MNHTVRITLITILTIATIAYAVGGVGSYKDRGDYENKKGDILLSSDCAEMVWYSLDDTWASDDDDAADANTVSVRASQSLTETYYGRWPIDSGEPNSVLMTPGDTDSQWVWAIVDANLVDVNDSDANDVVIGKTWEGQRFFGGVIDEVALFDVALTAEEIKRIAENGLERGIGLTAVEPPSKLAATWGMLKAGH